jgi:BirA family transcriptional regulator, biotin operon repressor / biotin---[acetyl-CoA-carboxylase] ligase
MTLPASCFDSIAAGAVLPLLLDSVQPGAPWIAGSPFEYRPTCPSTNAALKELADQRPTGAALVTDDQTGGRGRSGRTWLSRPGVDLTFSVLLRPTLEPARGHLLALATGVAVAEVLEKEFGLQEQVSLKWPNDVLLDRRKVCGILLEASADMRSFHWAVAGIGINVNSEPGRMLASLSSEQAAEWRGRPQPVSIKEHLGRAVPRAPLLAGLLARLTFRWTRLEQPAGVPDLLGEWRRRDALAGRRVQVLAGADRSECVAAGEAAGIGDEGQLLVRLSGAGRSGRERGPEGAFLEVFAGDVSVAAACDDLTDDLRPG